MNINKIKKAFSCMIMQAPTGKAVHLSLILVIGVSLFSRHIISSSSGKALDLSQNPDFVKIEEAEPVLVLPARTQIQGAIIHQNNGGVVIKTLN